MALERRRDPRVPAWEPRDRPVPTAAMKAATPASSGPTGADDREPDRHLRVLVANGSLLDGDGDLLETLGHGDIGELLGGTPRVGRR